MKRKNHHILTACIILTMSVNMSISVAQVNQSGRVEANPIQQVNEKIFNVKGVKLVMRFVNSGEMILGKDDNTLHIEITDDFWVSETEITNEMWNAVMGTSYKTLQCAHCARWLEANDFVKRLNNLTGEHFRLITEAEWEYTARYGNKNLRYSGSNNFVDVWRDDMTGVKESKEGALNKPNFLGIYGMNSKIGEWCYDYYNEKYPPGKHINYKGPKSSEPTMNGTFRVIRGTGDKVFQTMGENTNRTYGMENFEFAHIRLAMTNNDVTKNLKTPPVSFQKKLVNLPNGMEGNWRAVDTRSHHFLMNINKERQVLDAVDNKIGYGYLAETDDFYNPKKYYVITTIVVSGARIATITYEDPEGVEAPQKLRLSIIVSSMTGTIESNKSYYIAFQKSLF